MRLGRLSGNWNRNHGFYWALVFFKGWSVVEGWMGGWEEECEMEVDDKMLSEMYLNFNLAIWSR